MRRSRILRACGFVVLLATCVRADDQADARVIIDKAIEAAGGKEALAKYEGPFYVERKGMAVAGGGKTMPFTQRITKRLPDKSRVEQRATADGPVTFGMVFNGTKGWYGVREMDAAAVVRHREQLYGEWVATLAPLSDVAFQLTTVDEITLDNRPAIGVKVSHKDRPEVRLYFDKGTFALVKLVRRVGETGIYEEAYADDYADVDGVVYAKKTVVYGNGKMMHEVEITKLKFIDPPADDFFDHP